MLAFHVSKEEGIHPVTILHVQGKLDGSNYETLIDAGQKLFESGSRDLLLDLADLTYLSSAGISALHRVAMLFQGKQRGELEEGWQAFRAIERDRSDGVQKHVKLLNPTHGVEAVLKLVGFDAYFEIFTELHGAVTSFQ